MVFINYALLQRSVPLIKEWREVMTEVGDHQSLVASLKQSTYFHMFKVGWLKVPIACAATGC